MDGVDTEVPPSGPGCVECTTELPAGWWLHLRRCAQCGHVGCCDSSPGQHARQHFVAHGHRYVQSYEPGEDWYWDFAAGRYVEGPELARPTSRPLSQSTPGPLGRVPHDWMSLLH